MIRFVDVGPATYTSCNKRLHVTASARGLSSGAVYSFDPLTDTRWESFLKESLRASLFHSRAWLSALKQTYGYSVVGYTTSSPGAEIENAMVFCEVESWLTGRRLVALPFSDHCQPLVDKEEDWETLICWLIEEMRREEWRYVELRPLRPIPVPGKGCLHSRTVKYHFHELDLRPDIEMIFNGFHKDSIRRKIQRAERENLDYVEGRSDDLLDEFYRLITLTRRRHRLPPQPRKWFENLVASFGEELKIRIARTDRRAVAGMITIRHKDTMVYKYGGSDSRFNNLGGVQLLYWKAIQDAKACGLRRFDLGRTDDGQEGLVTFKNRWGAKEDLITYTRYSLSQDTVHLFDLSPSNSKSLSRELLAHLPNGVVSLLGRALYKHIG